MGATSTAEPRTAIRGGEGTTKATRWRFSRGGRGHDADFEPRDLLDDAIAAGAREENFEMTTGPLDPAQTLYHRFAGYNGLEPDLNTHFPKNPERFGYASADDEARARPLVVHRGPFLGQTKPAVVRHLVEANSCITMTVARYGISATLAVDRETTAGEGSDLIVCAGHTCG